jgi:hypothetical protein
VLRRILFSYLGGVGVPLCLLPIGKIDSMGGHYILFIVLIFCPIGLFAGLLYADIRRHVLIYYALIRSFFAVAILILLLILLGGLSELIGGPFFKNDSWILLPILGPALCAVFSEFLLSQDIKRDK